MEKNKQLAGRATGNGLGSPPLASVGWSRLNRVESCYCQGTCCFQLPMQHACTYTSRTRLTRLMKNLRFIGIPYIVNRREIIVYWISPIILECLTYMWSRVAFQLTYTNSKEINLYLSRGRMWFIFSIPLLSNNLYTPLPYKNKNYMHVTCTLIFAYTPNPI